MSNHVVKFPNGNAYSADGSTSKDMLNGGHADHFMPLVGDVIAIANSAISSAAAAKTSETNAKASETAAKSSQTAAKTSETAALASKNAAAASQAAAKTSEVNALASEVASRSSETAAAGSAAAAKASAEKAEQIAGGDLRVGPSFGGVNAISKDGGMLIAGRYNTAITNGITTCLPAFAKSKQGDVFIVTTAYNRRGVKVKTELDETIQLEPAADSKIIELGPAEDWIITRSDTVYVAKMFHDFSLQRGTYHIYDSTDLTSLYFQNNGFFVLGTTKPVTITLPKVNEGLTWSDGFRLRFLVVDSELTIKQNDGETKASLVAAMAGLAAKTEIKAVKGQLVEVIKRDSTSWRYVITDVAERNESQIAAAVDTAKEGSWTKPYVMGSNGDWNNLAPGVYAQGANAQAITWNNRPNDYACVAEVFKTSYYERQIVYVYNSNVTLVRQKYSSAGSWTAWEPLVRGSRYLPGQLVPVSATLSGAALSENRLLLCNGALLNRVTYAALFAAIGTRYGAGDGSTTFQIPAFANGETIVSSSTGSKTPGSIAAHNHGASTTVSWVGGHAHTAQSLSLSAISSLFPTTGNINHQLVLGTGSAATSVEGGHAHTATTTVDWAGSAINIAAGVYTNFYIAY